jgi:ubiquinone/menaquinone biosynthesis C-methylase UbiE
MMPNTYMNKKETERQDEYADLRCPDCRGILTAGVSVLSCPVCKRLFPVTGGIADFRDADGYWGNVSREKMRVLNARAEASGDWLAATRELIPEYLGAIAPFDRADARFLWPFDSNSRILDAGSMWGALTLPAARQCREIYALDKTLETLDFLRIRAGQEGYKNVRFAAATLDRLPFADGFFDMVILNGVLEWVASEEDVVLEEHWEGRRKQARRHRGDPRRMQVEALKEIRRVLKPGGRLYLAIENRFGYPYLAGAPDDHVNLKYVSFLPRFLANAITKHQRGNQYRTYTYGLPGYRKLLRDAGFSDAEFYGAFPHYFRPSEIIPEAMIKDWKDKVLPMKSPLAPAVYKAAARLFPAGWLKQVAPSFIILAGNGTGSPEERIIRILRNGTGSPEARIIRTLREAGVIAGAEAKGTRAVMAASRPGDHHTANFMIYKPGETEPAYFCKVCRDEGHTEIVTDEAKNLRTVSRRLEGTGLGDSVPQLIYAGTSDGVTLLVTGFLRGEPSPFNPRGKLTRRNLANLDKSVRAAIGFLAGFQRETRAGKVVGAPYLHAEVLRQKEILAAENRLTPEIDASIAWLLGDIRAAEDFTLPLAAVQGDYDFYTNILFDGDKVRVVDFEHFAPEGLPFIDLATLIYHPVILNFNSTRTDKTLAEYIAKNKLTSYLDGWYELYSELTGMPLAVARLAGRLAALAQQTREYPPYRDPNTYPMYPAPIFEEMMTL